MRWGRAARRQLLHLRVSGGSAADRRAARPWELSAPAIPTDTLKMHSIEKRETVLFSWSKNILYESIFYSGISTPNHIFSWNATKQPCLELLNFLSTPTLKGFLFTSECKRCVFENVLCLFWMVWKFSVRIKRKRALRESENQSKEKYDSNWERK